MAGTSALITGLSGTRLTHDERDFLRDAQPWALILFARNVESPDQVSRLIADARAELGWRAPVLIDQEGGRVARLRPPHWLDWEPLGDLIARLDGEALDDALWLRYRLIAAELIALGIDVDCMPLADVPQPGSHEIIGNRALGSDPETVAARGQVVCEALKAGGVLPVIKHLPGHGRAGVDSHLSLPRVAAPRAELEAVDFAAFRPLAGEALGMTAHIVFEALDPEDCATQSEAAIRAIREEIGFQGLLMTDDLSMQALDGPIAIRAQRSLMAGCDLVLHCNGDLGEMTEAAGAVPQLAGRALDRATRAAAARSRPEPFDFDAGLARYRTLTGELTHA